MTSISYFFASFYMPHTLKDSWPKGWKASCIFLSDKGHYQAANLKVTSLTAEGKSQPPTVEDYTAVPE